MSETYEVPNRQPFLSSTLPENIDLPEFEQATNWERQEILNEFRKADTHLREVIQSATEQLNRLHEHGTFSKGALHNTSSRLVQAAMAGESLYALCNGLLHRLALAEDN